MTNDMSKEITPDMEVEPGHLWIFYSIPHRGPDFDLENNFETMLQTKGWKCVGASWNVRKGTREVHFIMENPL